MQREPAGRRQFFTRGSPKSGASARTVGWVKLRIEPVAPLGRVGGYPASVQGERIGRTCRNWFAPSSPTNTSWAGSHVSFRPVRIAMLAR